MDDGFGKIIILFLLILFLVWLFTDGPNHPNVDQPFQKPYTEEITNTTTTTTTPN